MVGEGRGDGGKGWIGKKGEQRVRGVCVDVKKCLEKEEGEMWRGGIKYWVLEKCWGRVE